MVSIFAMTEKGFAVVSTIIGQFGSSFIELVIGSKDNRIDEDYYDAIKALCLKNNIPFADRKSRFEIKTAFCFAISWQWLINLEEDKKLIVFHDSLLPKYRGFAPLVNALINGEKEIGVTAIFASAEYDKGDIICQSKTSIVYPVKIAKAIEINNANYITTALHVCRIIKEEGQLKGTVQNEAEATYSLWRDEEDYRINWNLSAEQIKRHIDASGFPYKAAFAFDGERKIRILDAEMMHDLQIVNRDAGKFIQVTDGMPVVVCGQGLIKITAAVYDDNKADFLPIKKFRTRLT
jgi:methionyl-tRNA formyltransferase